MPAVPGAGKDKIMILEDTNGDGKADHFTDVQGGLNMTDRRNQKKSRSSSLMNARQSIFRQSKTSVIAHQIQAFGYQVAQHCLQSRAEFCAAP